MGKKKGRGVFNDFLDGEKLRDNAGVRNSLQGATSTHQPLSPPPTRQAQDGRGKGRGKRGKPPLTHFLCLPLVNDASKPQLERGLEAFRKELEGKALVPLEAVRPVGTLHLTLGVMSLDGEGLEGVGRCLGEVDLGGMLRDAMPVQAIKPLSVDLKGLVSMQQPHKTSILYAEPNDTTSRLYPFASALRNHFTEHGFLIEESRPLKLHATIVNTVYAKPGRRREQHLSKAQATADVVDAREDSASNHKNEKTIPPDPSTGETEVPTQKEVDRSEGHGPNAKSWMRFDARELISQYKDLVWADNVQIDKVQICKMGAKKLLDEESGEVVAEEYEEVFSHRIGA